MEQLSFLEQNLDSEAGLLTLPQASAWATRHIGRDVTTANISYLIQYGRVRRVDYSGKVYVSIKELDKYYNSYEGLREINQKKILGNDINWHLSFSHIKEAESTKHVHRLHPYKGKFIPQLVEYFIDTHTDNFKKEIYFNPDDTIIDPFSGSGTTLVQANECGINAIGIDISDFNAFLSNCKIAQYDFEDLHENVRKISCALKKFSASSNIAEFENKLLDELAIFNGKYFPVPDYKYNLRQGKISEYSYGSEKEKLFAPIYDTLVREYDIKLYQDDSTTFLGKWFSPQIRREIDFVYNLIREIENKQTQKIMMLILSRTMRSCRATTHSDLATLTKPITSTYYCSKHGKICKPLFSIIKWWGSYCSDTISRLYTFDELRTATLQYCIAGDSRSIDIEKELSNLASGLSEKIAYKKVAGIFSSPPYVGMIDYHEQHAYAYDLFGLSRNDDSEIGPLFRGKGREARETYVDGISKVLLNCKSVLADDYNVFLVANDRYNLYETIAKNAGMQIVNTFKRPVLNRSERDKTAYSETIFHMKEKGKL